MKKIIIIAAIALVVIIIGVVLLFVFVFNKPGGETEKPVTYFEYPLDEMYSNIAEQGKILKSQIVIQYTDEKLVDQLNNNKTRIVNDINELYRTKTMEQLSAKNGQSRLREEIVELVQEILEAEPDQISDVFFLDFIIQ